MSKSKGNTYLKASLAGVAFLGCIIVLVLKLGVLDFGGLSGDGLSGLVEVKGTVSAEALHLSADEVKKINRTVESHRATFTKVALFLDAKGGGDPGDEKTVLVMAMVLETDEDCEIRSWSRKVVRSDLVTQMVLYMKKAAGEYEKFKRYPDVKQDFKCLYI